MLLLGGGKNGSPRIIVGVRRAVLAAFLDAIAEARELALARDAGVGEKPFRWSARVEARFPKHHCMLCQLFDVNGRAIDFRGFAL